MSTGSRFSQRGTLVVVCLATAMLMLDIAVVNTALKTHGRPAVVVPEGGIRPPICR